MTNVFSVNYDLRAKSKPDYKGLEDELKRSPAWWHYLESTWLILTTESANQLSNRLLPHIHKKDHLLVIEVKNASQGWLPKGAWKWINDHVPESATA